MADPTLVTNIAQSIAKMEGYFNSGPPNLSQINNNPGNITKGWTSNLPNDGKFVVFPDAASGWQNLYQLVGQYLDGKYTGGKTPTLQQMFAVYAPSGDKNNPVTYAKNVSSWTGIPIDVPLDKVTLNPMIPLRQTWIIRKG